MGAVNEDMRLALNAQQELADLATNSSSETTRWLTIIGNPPLKAVFEQAFNLPSSFGVLDVDRQVSEFQEH